MSNQAKYEDTSSFNDYSGYSESSGRIALGGSMSGNEYSCNEDGLSMIDAGALGFDAGNLLKWLLPGGNR